MISNRLLQESLEDFKEIVRLPMALYDRNCTCVAGAENMAPEKDLQMPFNSSLYSAILLSFFNQLKKCGRRCPTPAPFSELII